MGIFVWEGRLIGEKIKEPIKASIAIKSPFPKPGRKHPASISYYAKLYVPRELFPEVSMFLIGASPEHALRMALETVEDLLKESSCSLVNETGENIKLQLDDFVCFS